MHLYVYTGSAASPSPGAHDLARISRRLSETAASDLCAFAQHNDPMAFRVGVEVVRELYGVMAAKGAAGGFVVTSGRFTDEARNFAEGRNVQLVDGARLRALIKQAAGTSQQGAAKPAGGSPGAAAPVAAAPSCPICAMVMVQRTAKRGANAGNAFWGCSGYPSCKGTRPIG